MKNAGKRLSALFAALMMFVMSAANCMTAFAADDVSAVPITVKYDQAGARSMLKMINEFRTGSDAWYRNEDGSIQELSGLSEFEYDYGLEQAAMQRAAEIAVLFGHTRPDGSDCFTASEQIFGENISTAYGWLTTAEQAFTYWQETDRGYSGQGHRRNMLGEYSYIGIAHVTTSDGSQFWVQEFGFYPTGIEKKDVGTGQTTVNVNVKNNYIENIYLSPSIYYFEMTLGSTADVPTVTAEVYTNIPGDFSSYSIIQSTLSPDWSVSGDTVSVSGGKITANALGDATLTTTICGKDVSVYLQVICATHKWGDWNTTAATCTKDGKQTRTCSACGAIEEQVIKAKGHSYGEYKVVRKATASQEGLEERTCSVCGDKQQRTIARTATTTTKTTTTKTTSEEVTTAPESEETTPQETTTAEVTTVEVTTPQESEVTTTENTESDKSTESEVTTTENTESSEITEPSGEVSADSENNNGKKVLFIVLGGAGGLTAVGVIFAIIRKIRR